MGGSNDVNDVSARFASVPLRSLWIPLLNPRLIKIYAKNLFWYFQVFSDDFIILYTYFTHIAASTTVIDNVLN